MTYLNYFRSHFMDFINEKTNLNPNTESKPEQPKSDKNKIVKKIEKGEQEKLFDIDRALSDCRIVIIRFLLGKCGIKDPGSVSRTSEGWKILCVFFCQIVDLKPSSISHDNYLSFFPFILFSFFLSRLFFSSHLTCCFSLPPFTLQLHYPSKILQTKFILCYPTLNYFNRK